MRDRRELHYRELHFWPLDPLGRDDAGVGVDGTGVVVDGPPPQRPGEASGPRIWDLAQLQRLPLLPLAGCWIVAVIGHAAVANWFMWLVFLCAALLAALDILERAIHALEAWDARQRRR